MVGDVEEAKCPKKRKEEKVYIIYTNHQWLRQISMKLPFAVLRKSALKFTKGSKSENSISYYTQRLVQRTLVQRIRLE